MKNQGIKIDLINSKSSLLNLINNQINNCNIQYMMQWERDHSTSPVEKDKKIKELEAMKEEIKAYFESVDSQELPLDLKLPIDIFNRESRASA